MEKEQDLLALCKVCKQVISELVISVLTDSISAYSNAIRFEAKAALLTAGATLELFLKCR